MWRGALRNTGQIWHKSFDNDPAPAHARSTRFIHAHQTVQSLGILDGGCAYPGAKTLKIYDPNANTHGGRLVFNLKWRLGDTQIPSNFRIRMKIPPRRQIWISRQSVRSGTGRRGLRRHITDITVISLGGHRSVRDQLGRQPAFCLIITAVLFLSTMTFLFVLIHSLITCVSSYM
jgi:hypothetical protein